TAAQQRRPLTTIGAFGLLDAEIETLQSLADLDRDQRAERDIDHDCRKGQNGAAVAAEEIQSLHMGRHLDQLLTDEESRQEHADNTHDEANGAAGHALDRFLQALIDIVGLRSEERRVGKECRARWWTCDYNKIREQAVVFRCSECR